MHILHITISCFQISFTSVTIIVNKLHVCSFKLLILTERQKKQKIYSSFVREKIRLSTPCECKELTTDCKLPLER